MGRARPTVIGLQATLTSGDGTFLYVNRYRGATVGADAIEAGGRIDVSSGSSALAIEDQNGVSLYSSATSADTTIDPVPRGVRLPLKAITTGSGTLVGTVYWSVKK